jgi:Tol biopolymer transport system component
LDEVSADATHAFFTTNLSLAPEDTDGFGIDVYDISGGRATLVSSGPFDAGPGGGFASFMGASPDGARVFFEAFLAPKPGSPNACPSLFERFAGQTALLASNPSPPSPPVCESAKFGGVSADGTHVFFTSGAGLEPGDEAGDGDDIYQRVGTSLARLTTYPKPEGECVEQVNFADSSSDGGIVLFSTSAQVLPEDTDLTIDVYKRRPDGSFVLVSRGTDGGRPPCGPLGGDRPVALSADGSTAVFETTARLSPADSDSSNDLYGADDSGAIELLSTGPTDPNADERSIVFPDWLTLASDDARRVAFETPQPLVAADKDAAPDVYLRAAGQTELISSGLPGKATKAYAELLGFSADGSTVVFATRDALVASDLDRDRDVYLRRSGARRSVLLSGETIPPEMRVSKRGRILRSGRVGLALSCPKAETSGPCHGKLKLKTGRRGKLIGSTSFEIPAGKRKLLTVRPRRMLSPSRHSIFATMRGMDQLGNGATVARRVTLVGH